MTDNHETLKAELKRIHNALNDDRVDLSITAAEAIIELRKERDALAEDRWREEWSEQCYENHLLKDACTKLTKEREQAADKIDKLQAANERLAARLVELEKQELFHLGRKRDE